MSFAGNEVESYTQSVEDDEENKLKELNDLLKKGKETLQMVRKEDEEEFDLFIKRLNERNLQTIRPTSEIPQSAEKLQIPSHNRAIKDD